MTERDLYEPVSVSSWTIVRCNPDNEHHREGDGEWMLETKAVTLSGEKFTARKHYHDIEEIFDFIREIAT